MLKLLRESLSVLVLSGCDTMAVEHQRVRAEVQEAVEVRDATYAVALVDLDGDRDRDAVVWLQGRQLCGSGGCRVRIYRNQLGTFEEIGSLRTVKLPIRVLETTTAGLNDLGVYVSGGGVPGHEVRIQFGGSRYPDHPFGNDVTSAANIRGTVLIDSNSAQNRLRETPDGG